MYPDNWEVVDVERGTKRIHHFGSAPEFANIPGKVTINDLPPEIIVNISRHIADGVNTDKIHCSYEKDFPRYNSRFLLQLALCSRYLYQLVEPVLYERFHHGAKMSVYGFQLFMLRILVRPDLGRSVRIFHLDDTEAPAIGFHLSDHEDDINHTFTEDCDGMFDTAFKDESCLTTKDLKAIRKKIAETSMTSQECSEWAVGVEKGDLNAMVALILTLTPNLQELDIDIWTRPDSVPPVLTRMLALTGQLQRKGQLGNPLALWGLKKVVVRYQHAVDIDDLTHHLISLLTIPSVEILCATHDEAKFENDFLVPKTDVNEEGLEAALQGNNLRLANMKELSLSLMLMSPKALFRLWSCCPGVKKLHYKDNLDNASTGPFVTGLFMDNNLMAEASGTLPHLQDLSILNEGCIWGSIMTSSSMSALAPFKSLRRLEISWPVFLRCGDMDKQMQHVPSSQSIIGAIPPSLEHLCVSARPFYAELHHDIALASVFDFLQQKHRLPALKTLDFGWVQARRPGIKFKGDTIYHRGFTEEDYLQVLARCQDAGVELILKPLAPPMPAYIQYRVDDDGNREPFGDTEVLHVVHYPYDNFDDYHRICKENECDLTTGRPHDWETLSDGSEY